MPHSGVTSSVRGEGKSTTTDLDYSMRETGEACLVIEADMRLPTSPRLGLNNAKGISNLLAGPCTGADVLEKSGLHRNLWVSQRAIFHRIPLELLGSEQRISLGAGASDFDDILLMPPVRRSGSAGFEAGQRHGSCESGRTTAGGASDEAVRRLRFADAKLLGF